MKKSKLELIFKPSKELIEFADYFSNNYKKLNIGEYSSRNNNYEISYLSEIEETPTVFRTHRESGLIQIDKRTLKKNKFTNNFVFYMIIWCAIIKEIPSFLNNHSYELCDLIAINYYKKTGRPTNSIIKGYELLLRENLNYCNERRFKELKNQLSLK